MGRKPKQILITDELRQQLVRLHKTDKRFCVRQRCQVILLKVDGYISKEVGRIVQLSEVSVVHWIKRFEQFGIEGLYTKPGRGRKSILSGKDLATVRKEVVRERQRLSQAKIIIEQELDKQFSQRTLTRFLKVMTAGISA